MFLNYFALFLILTVLVIIFYTFIYIHELPYEAAKHRKHPQEDAIYVACWLSLFTLHAIWPLVFIWALSHKGGHESPSDPESTPSVDWVGRFAELENRLKRMEDRQSTSTKGSSTT